MPDHTIPSPPELMTVDTKTAATLLNSTDVSLEKDRSVGHMGVPYVRAGRRVVYRLADLRDWLSANRVVPRAEG
jgi:hypothetical protein